MSADKLGRGIAGSGAPQSWKNKIGNDICATIIAEIAFWVKAFADPITPRLCSVENRGEIRAICHNRGLAAQKACFSTMFVSSGPVPFRYFNVDSYFGSAHFDFAQTLDLMTPV